MSDDIRVGTLKKLADGSCQGILSRCFEGHSAASVWAMLVEPAKIALWIAPGHIELKVGGAVSIDFEDSGFAIKSQVLELENGKRLTFSWSSGNEPQRPLRWEVSEAGGDATLTLTVTTPAVTFVSGTLAVAAIAVGWSWYVGVEELKTCTAS